jgi:hypothetical protein
MAVAAPSNTIGDARLEANTTLYAPKHADIVRARGDFLRAYPTVVFGAESNSG